MAAKIYKETGQHIAPKGPLSSYRTYQQQVYMRQIYGSNAAVPGTSNHGWGLAVDTAYDAVINKYGAPYGWQKAWSDASWEPWHFKYAAGHYHGGNPGPDYHAGPERPSWWNRVKGKLQDARKKYQHKKARRRESDRPSVRARLHAQLTRLRHWIKWASKRLKKHDDWKD